MMRMVFRRKFFASFWMSLTVLLFLRTDCRLAESIEASEVVAPEYWTTPSQFPIDLGIDFGRKKDLTVSWASEKISDLQVTKGSVVPGAHAHAGPG